MNARPDEDRALLLVAASPVGSVGEEAVLLETVRWLTEHTDAEVRVVLTSRGTRTAEIEALAPTAVVSELGTWTVGGVIERLWFRLGSRERGYRKRAARLGLPEGRRRRGLYLHAVAAVEALHYLPAGGTPVVCRLSDDLEPDGWGLTRLDQTLLIDRVDRFVAAAPRARDEVAALGGDSGRVRTLEPLVGRVAYAPPNRATPHPGDNADRGPFTVGAFAPSPPEDPPDLPVHLASLLARAETARPVRWVWMVDREAVAFWVEHDLERLGLEGSVQLARTPSERDELFRRCDLLVFLPRDEVVAPRSYLEAAGDGVPLIGYEAGALAPYIGADEGGFLVPYLDVAAVAAGVAALAGDPERYRRCGERIAVRAREHHGIPAYAADLWSEFGAVWGDDA